MIRQRPPTSAIRWFLEEEEVAEEAGELRGVDYLGEVEARVVAVEMRQTGKERLRRKARLPRTGRSSRTPVATRSASSSTKKKAARRGMEELVARNLE